MTYVTVNSADSHVFEPLDLWEKNLPKRMRDLGPVTRKDGDWEVVSIDGKVIRREPMAFLEATRPPGCWDPKLRLADLDDQGVWTELIFASRGLWVHMSDDPDLQAACCRVYNDWLWDEYMAYSPRFIGAAMLPALDTGDAVAELERAVGLGYRTVYLPTCTPAHRRYNNEDWKPLWAAAEDAGVSISFHTGTGRDPILYGGPGAFVTSFVATSHDDQTALMHLVASGALEDHPTLHVSFCESGGSWLPSVMERMDEAQRNYDPFYVRPKLPLRPSEYIRRQAHVSFQHSQAVLRTLDITGLEAIMWGSDYPHLEGTFPNTQKALEETFHGVPHDVYAAIAGGNFAKIFPVPEHPTRPREGQAEE